MVGENLVTLVAVCKGKDDFVLESFEVKEMDAKEIGRKIDTDLGWSINRNDFEVFCKKNSTWLWVARFKGRTVRYASYVKNWDKFSSPAWVKHVKSNTFYKG